MQLRDHFLTSLEKTSFETTYKSRKESNEFRPRFPQQERQGREFKQNTFRTKRL